MDIKPFNNEIILINNYLSQLELENIMYLIKDLDSSSWSKLNNHVNERYRDKVIEVISITYLNNIWEKVEKHLRDIIPNSGESYFEPALLKALSKDGLDPHWDDRRENDPIPGRDNIVSHGIVLYLNDNFSGGEVYYPNLNIQYKPQAGDLLVHPGSKEYTHGVKNIESGTRYFITSFIRQGVGEPKFATN